MRHLRHTKNVTIQIRKQKNLNYIIVINIIFGHGILYNNVTKKSHRNQNRTGSTRGRGGEGVMAMDNLCVIFRFSIVTHLYTGIMTLINIYVDGCPISSL